MIFVGKSLTAEGGQNPDRAGRAGQGDGLRPEHAELRRRWCDSFPGAGRRRAGAGRGGVGEGAWRNCWPIRRAASNWAATRSKVVRENLGAIDRTVDMIVKHLDDGELYIAPEALSVMRRTERSRPSPRTTVAGYATQNPAAFVEEDALEIHLQRLRVGGLGQRFLLASPCPSLTRLNSAWLKFSIPSSVPVSMAAGSLSSRFSSISFRTVRRVDHDLQRGRHRCRRWSCTMRWQTTACSVPAS